MRNFKEIEEKYGFIAKLGTTLNDMFNRTHFLLIIGRDQSIVQDFMGTEAEATDEMHRLSVKYPGIKITLTRRIADVTGKGVVH